MSIVLKLSLQRADFDLAVDTYLPDRGITALFGPSGAGKTSLLRCIAGLERPSPQLSAYINMNGEIWQDETLSLPSHQRSIGYVFQEASLLPHLSVQGNLEYGYKRTPLAKRQINFDRVIDLLGLPSMLQRRVEELSGGQRQRVAIGRALLSNPKLLLMDEPLASLDDQSKANILSYIAEVQDEFNIPTLYVTHSVNEIVRIANHLLILDSGRITAEGEINQLLIRDDLPFAHHADVGVTLNGLVSDHDEKFHLTTLKVPGGQLTVSTNSLAINTSVRIRLLARDISLALAPPEQSSIQNVLRARVNAIMDDPDPAHVVVTLGLDEEACLARITRRAAHQLDLTPGKPVFAQIKSVAVHN